MIEISGHHVRRQNREAVLLWIQIGVVYYAHAQNTRANYTITGGLDTATESVVLLGLQASPSPQSVQEVIYTSVSDTYVLLDTCRTGTYSTTDASTCTSCPAGTYSNTVSASSSAACIPCDQGSYSTSIAASSSSTCQPCPSNTYYNETGGTNVGVCVSCPQYTTSNPSSKNLGSCVCDPGYYGPNGGPCIPCKEGAWCSVGASNPCPSNSNSTALSSSLAQCLCKPGYFGDTTISSINTAGLCQFCKEDHYCPGGAVNATTRCTDGKYSLAGSDDAGDCTCPVNAVSQQRASQVAQCVCESGYYKVYKANAALGGWVCEVCLPGQFCYDNTNRTCPPHSVSLRDAKSVLDCFCTAGYANATVQTEQELCVDCPANSYCPGKGVVSRCGDHAVSPTQSRDESKCYCDLGWKGVNNSVCTECQSPTYCYGGIESQCAEGTFSESMSWGPSNCSCIPGRWGPQGGPCIKCSAGKYNLLPGCTACSNTTDTDCVKCEEGTASTVEGRNSACDACPNGTFAFPAGATACTTCPNGTYSHAKAGACTKCALGWWAPEGSNTCTPCPVNTYLNLEGKGDASACIPCPEGTISSRIGNSDPACSACSPGSYQQKGVCISCPAGTYSKSASVTCKTCGVGTYSLENATTCVECDVGTYTNVNGSSECALCTAGSFAASLGRSVCTACNQGYYVEHEGAVGCKRCGYGEFSGLGASACSQCPGGSWSTDIIESEANCTSCGKGMYSTTLGATTKDECISCAGGTYSSNPRANQVS